MNLKPTIIFCLSFWLIFTAGAAAEIHVKARVDRNQVAPGESFRLMVTIDNADGTVDTDNITDFIIHSQGTSSSMQIINGRTSRQVTYNYMLIPKKQGRLNIPALDVEVDGKPYRTEPIVISVADRTDDDKSGTSRDVWISSEVSHTAPYVGQQIIYTFSLFNAVQISDAKFQPPDFDGFDARELEKRNTFTRSINGRDHVVTQVQYILIPRRTGTLIITPATLQVGVVRPDTQRRKRLSRGFDSIFDDPFFNRGVVDERVLQSKALQVQVNPLPVFQGPGVFSGLVGQFDLSAAIEKNELKVGGSTTLALTLSGRGNIMDAPAPALNIPPALKTYGDTPEDDINMSNQGFSGKKIFRTALVPVEPGEFNLTPASLVYFDIEEQDYITLNATPISITVAPGAVAQNTPITITPDLPENKQQAVAFTGRDILPVKEDLNAVISQTPLSFTGFTIWMVTPMFFFAGSVLIRRTLKKDRNAAVQMKIKARQALKHATVESNDQGVVLGHLYQAVSAAILSTAGRYGEALTWEEAEKRLLDSGQNPELARQCADLLARIESSKFSNTRLTGDQLKTLIGSTRQMVRKLAS
jgi:hypothetical protein